MPLKYTLDTLDGVDDGIAKMYVERDGKFVLDVADLPEPDGLKSALENERKLRRQHEKQVKAWEKIGKTPDEISELLGNIQAEDERKARESGDHAKILQQKQDAWNREKEALSAELNAARASERKAIIETSLTTELAKAGATEEGVDLLTERLSRRIKFEMDGGERIIRILASDGETPLAGSAKDGTATFADLVKEAADKFPALFKGEGKGGGGKLPPNKAGRSGVTKKSDFKTERERGAFVREHGLQAYQSLPD